MFGFGEKIDTLLGQGAEFRGNLSVEGGIVVDGRVEGNIAASDRITLGQHANVRGNLNAPEVVVGGRLQGNINGGDRVELLASAQVAGDIRCQRLVMAEGALVTGKIGMEPLAPGEAAPDYRLIKKQG